ncbi:hypothetical protein BOX15_Mlig031899g1 [Macrostomum lignano]|uniref:Uncharacterized protein n=1 Tax=Macrostomum lignano TaxID=282301 RepID=A0A267ECX0_9PLAT|nr:hypothetical protein BOX15_Mlig031899g1 [Macrostomum lignano]
MAQADINLQRKNRMSPLYIASQNGNWQAVDFLIKALANVDAVSDTGSSPIFTASQNGHHRVVHLLIKANASANQQLLNGCSPLYAASESGHRQVVGLLIKAQADANLPSRNGCSPLFVASQNGHEQVVKLLIEAGAVVNLQDIEGRSALFISSQQGHHQIVENLIKAEADLNAQDFQGCSPLYIASQQGHSKVALSLIKANADVNQQKHDGVTPLHIASQNGFAEIVEALLEARAEVGLLSESGQSALTAAFHGGHRAVMSLLIKSMGGRIVPNTGSVVSKTGSANFFDELLSGSALVEYRLSQRLSSALCKSGFVDSRAALQSAIADVLQAILQNRRSDKSFVVGSYSEGWGNNLKTLDGRTDSESDIDVMSLIPGRLYHLRGICSADCSDANERVDYINGHVKIPGYASSPATPFHGSSLKPAVDQVDASRLCRYPPIAPLQPDRVIKSNIPQHLLESLRQELLASPCHVVHAASPGQDGEQLRVSTTFLEKRMLRSLSTLQGQLFIVLKYLIKKIISNKYGFNVAGFKSYHAKTITFRMVEETPSELWKPENLLSLVRRSLHMLLDCVESSQTPDNAHGRVMNHFFLCNADIYLKGVEQKGSGVSTVFEKAAVTLKIVIDYLPQLLLQFQSSLKPASNSGRFYFHPFLLLPHFCMSQRPALSSGSLEFHEIYDVVREAIERLSHGDCGKEYQETLTALLARLPDCAFSAREALRIVASLKFGYRSTAKRIIDNCRGHVVSRGIDWSTERTATAATVEFVWRHMKSRDSLWRFCFEFSQRPAFVRELSADISECFPIRMSNYETYFYVNFDALLQSLRLELCGVGDADALDWIRDVARREDADEQELLSAALYSPDSEQVASLTLKLRHLVGPVPAWFLDRLATKWWL